MKKTLKKMGLDAIYVTNPINVRYLSGFSGSAGYLIILKNRKLFFTDFRYKEQAENEVEKNGFEIIVVKKSYKDEINKFFKENKIKKLGIEDKFITWETKKKLKKDNKNLDLKGIGDYILDLRLIKTEKEVETISKAIEITDNAFQYILREIKVGVTEREIAAKLEYFMKINGASKESFETVVASGYRSAMPHGVASDKKIAKDEFVKMDFGSIYNGYVSDMTRTVYIGDNITEKHLDIYNTVKEAQELAIKKAKAGMKLKKLDKIARDYISNKGYKENFGHGLGHGIGLEIHENPGISPRSKGKLKKGMVVTIEPGIYVEGFGGVRIEDDVLVKNNGVEILNKSSKELIILKP